MVIVLVFGLFVFGCTSPGGSQTGSQTGTGGSSTGQQTGGTGTSGATGGETTGGATGGASTGGSGTQGGTTDYAGMAYAELAALGVPLECDITSTAQGQPVSYKVYMKGEDEVRTEMPVNASSGSTCTKFIGIMKGNTFYMGCGTGEEMFEGTGCQWLEMELNESETSGGTTTTEQPDFSNTPSTQINCRPWVYDASKFIPTGKTCTFEEMMQAYQ